MNTSTRTTTRQTRHRRIRAKVTGSATRPRLAVYRSLKHLSVQLIDDGASKTLVGLSTKGTTANLASATKLGAELAKLATGQGITTVVFDRAGYRYHGQIKALADAARDNGLKF